MGATPEINKDYFQAIIEAGYTYKRIKANPTIKDGHKDKGKDLSKDERKDKERKADNKDKRDKKDTR